MHANAKPGLSLPLQQPTTQRKQALQPSAAKLSWAKRRMRPQPDTGRQTINMNSLDNSLEFLPGVQPYSSHAGISIVEIVLVRHWDLLQGRLAPSGAPLGEVIWKQMAEDKELQDLIEFLKSPKQQACQREAEMSVAAWAPQTCRISTTSVLSRCRRRH